MDLSPGPRFRLVPFTPELISRPDILQEGTAVTLDGPGSVCDSALECLRDLGPVWGFHVQNAQAFDLQMLYRFSSLKYLGLGSKVRGLDCTRWAALEWLIAEWSPQLILPTAESRLRRIRIRALTSQDLSALPPWGRLELAEILSSSKLCSLTGSERWSSLRMIACLKLARLRDISALAKCSKLEAVMFESCVEIQDMSALSGCPALHALTMSKCGDINSVAFVERSKQLEEVRLVKTWVRDGNMLPLSKLRNALFDYKSHYSHTQEQISALRRGRQ